VTRPLRARVVDSGPRLLDLLIGERIYY
jgi:hypothetical protein